ncbi:MAG: hypothetical protein ACYCR7_05195 [Thermoplasmataceae archaeon]
MLVRVHHLRSQDKNMGENLFRAFVASVEPPYIGILMRPSPYQWEEIMEEGFARISFDGEEMAYDLKVKYRIEVGENTIFFVTSDLKEFITKVKAIEKQEN